MLPPCCKLLKYGFYLFSNTINERQSIEKKRFFHFCFEMPSKIQNNFLVILSLLETENQYLNELKKKKMDLVQQ